MPVLVRMALVVSESKQGVGARVVCLRGVGDGEMLRVVSAGGW